MEEVCDVFKRCSHVCYTTNKVHVHNRHTEKRERERERERKIKRKKKKEKKKERKKENVRKKEGEIAKDNMKE